MTLLRRSEAPYAQHLLQARPAAQQARTSINPDLHRVGSPFIG